MDYTDGGKWWTGRPALWAGIAIGVVAVVAVVGGMQLASGGDTEPVRIIPATDDQTGASDEEIVDVVTTTTVAPSTTEVLVETTVESPPVTEPPAPPTTETEQEPVTEPEPTPTETTLPDVPSLPLEPPSNEDLGLCDPPGCPSD